MKLQGQLVSVSFGTNPLIDDGSTHIPDDGYDYLVIKCKRVQGVEYHVGWWNLEQYEKALNESEVKP